MKTLHIAYGFPPDPVGGTEVYVAALCRSLERLGVGAVVAAPGPLDTAYHAEGLTVRRFAVGSGMRRLEELYGEGDSIAAKAFERVLDEEAPDLVHQHAVSPACSIQLMASAKRRGVPVVFTYHTPAASCQRGTLMRWGAEPCDDDLESAPCTACTLHGLGVPRAVAMAATAMPETVGAAFGRAGKSGGIWTAARMASLVGFRRSATRTLFELPDRIVALSPWVRAHLLANGVPAHKIVSSAHGISHDGPVTARRPRNGPLHMAHLGRLDPTKGTRLLIRAVRAIPDLPLMLDIAGIVQSESNQELRQELLGDAAGDPRIRFLDPIAPSHVIEWLANYDVLAVPSQWLETGPLVVLEAFAAGTPIVGSALGGIAEKVEDEVNGLLVRPHDSSAAWCTAITRCATDDVLMKRLRGGIPQVRRMMDVAGEMCAVYAELVGAPHVASQPRDPSRASRVPRCDQG